MALEIQHASDVILQRVNRFFGWSAVGKIALRQAPLSRPVPRRQATPPAPSAVKQVSDTLGSVEDDELRDALAKLGASVGASIKRN